MTRTKTPDLTREEVDLLIQESTKINVFGYSVDEILRLSVDKITKLTGVKKSSVIFFESGISQKMAVSGFSKDSLHELPFNSIKSSPILKAISNKKVMMASNIHELEDMPLSMKKELEKENVVSMASAPMIINDELVGVLTIYGDGKNLFNAKQIYILSLLASQIAFAINNQKLIRKIRSEKLKLETVQDAIEDGLILFDIGGKAERILGMKKDIRGLIRKDYLSNQSAHFNQRVDSQRDPNEVFSKVVETGKTQEYFSSLKLSKETRTLQTRLSPIKRGNKIIGVTSNFRDVTDIENQKKEALLEKEKWQAVFDHTGDGVLVVNKTTRKILAANPALEKMVGYKEEEMLGKDFHCYVGLEVDSKGICKNCPISEALQKIEKKNYQSETIEIVLKRKDNSEFWGQVSLSVLKKEIERESLIIITVRDITKLKEVDQLKKDFTSIVSHELRTPLTAIKGFLSMIIKGDVGDLEAKQLHFLNRVYQSTERMVLLVEDLLVINRIETEKVSVTIKPISLNRVLQEVIDELTIKSLSKNIRVRVYIPQNFSNVSADADRLKQILYNLIGNAIKYSQAGSKVRVDVKINDEGMAEVSIKDQGVGISEFDMDKLFKKFSRIQNELSVKAGGSGLGLYITKSLVETQGGKVWAESEKGKGSNFTFTLPLYN